MSKDHPSFLYRLHTSSCKSECSLGLPEGKKASGGVWAKDCAYFLGKEDLVSFLSI